MVGISATYGTRLHSGPEVAALVPYLPADPARPAPLRPEALAAARRFADEIRPAAGERDLAQASPTAELDALARTGLLTLTVPAALGGPGTSYETLARTTAAIAAADASIAQITQGHYWALQILLEEGTAEQLDFFVPRVLAGLRFGNAVSERNTKHVGEMRTRLVALPDGRCSSTAPSTTPPARSTPTGSRSWRSTTRTARSPSTSSGTPTASRSSTTGRRSASAAPPSGTSTYDGVRVGPERVVPHWRILSRPTLFGTVGQVIHAAVDVGLAAGALDAAAAFVRERSRPHFEAARLGWERAADEPFVIQRFGQLAARVHAAEELLARGGRIMDETREAGIDAAGVARAAIAVGEAKAFAGDVALEVTNEVFALGGTRSADPAPAPRPLLARRAHPHAARPEPLEVLPRRQPLPQRRLPAGQRHPLRGADGRARPTRPERRDHPGPRPAGHLDADRPHRHARRRRAGWTSRARSPRRWPSTSSSATSAARRRSPRCSCCATRTCCRCSCPRELGGHGEPYRTGLEVVRLIARVDASIAHLLAYHWAFQTRLNVDADARAPATSSAAAPSTPGSSARPARRSTRSSRSRSCPRACC